MKKKSTVILIIILSVLLVINVLVFIVLNDKEEMKTIKSEKELLSIYNGKNTESAEAIANFVAFPFSVMLNGFKNYPNYVTDVDYVEFATNDAMVKKTAEAQELSGATAKDYSTTNIQVENVDEADIIKTDGDYIYSISNNKLIITNVKDEKDIKIESKTSLNDESILEDMILYKDKLVVISVKAGTSGTYYRYNGITCVKVYDITDKTKPNVIKSYEINEPYYTSRCVNNKLLIISSGNLRKDGEKIDRSYKEDGVSHEIELNSMKYLKDVETRKQTIIATCDLDNVKDKIKVGSYMIDVENAYVSEKAIYLLNQKYNYKGNMPPITEIFGLKGIIGLFTYEAKTETGYHTEIYKFDIKENGEIIYNSKNKIAGRTINQYSLDENNNHLRVAIYNNNGARVVIFDENMKQIGTTDYVAKGETMYSSRFIGNKAYLVTYKTMDPLFVIDLSDEKNPKILGELHIPGYSTYLHPYDENHLIGIGMQTEEVTRRNSSGKITSITSKITGMKMALFDVSNVSEPKELSSIVIGDSRTTSAILTNPKALLFSKEKELIAIPVNNYKEDFVIDTSAESYTDLINSYASYNKAYEAEGYFVYKINLEEGFKLKGVISHKANNDINSKGIVYYNYSKLLRGLYIDNNLYTVSENGIKVNKLDTLEQVSELVIK